ncbi:glycosyltransferase [Adhaeribacter soli]|uniref:Glycosyltransferase n=1 Tax=Adhaeribacter soli TaxID=2607655 RepID=A0A5N1J6P4_9BACT|nr:glycosyltransferase [Adhaeribacter soli]KAA9345632.1 glycosyltransferase [Adhaeribacter soli]
MIWLLTFLVLGYSLLIIGFLIGWNRLPVTVLPTDHKPRTRISVIIPIRNEAANILSLLQDLERQTYPAVLFEVLVVDDFSEDGSRELVRNFGLNANMQLRLLSLESSTGTGKKSAVAFGLSQAAGDFIVQTDGDCRVQPDWLKLLQFQYVSTEAKFISGPVCLQAGKALFEKMQVVEFASLIGSGAAAIGLKKPNMCNGANLAFEKKAFYEVGGYSGNEGIASGDDEFLMHKIQKQFPGKVAFLKTPDAVVFTSAKKQLPDFIAQRVRWASKWRFYRNVPAQVVGLLVFGANLALLLALILLLTGQLAAMDFMLIYIGKLTADTVFLGVILRFIRRIKYLFYTLPLQIVYVPYVLYCALAGLTGRYSWKGRMLNNRD